MRNDQIITALSFQKIVRIFLLGFLLVSSNTVASEHQSLQLDRPIIGSFEVGQKGRFLLPDDIFWNTNAFPRDLLVTTDSGNSCPFFIYQERSHTSVVEQINVDVLNQSFVQNENGNYMQFDVQIPTKLGNDEFHNQVKIETSGNDFIRRVEVYSKHQDGSLAELSSGYLLKSKKHSGGNNAIVNYPNADVDRLYIKVYPNARASDERFGLIHCEILKTKHSVVKMVDVPKQNIGVEQKDHTQEMSYDLLRANRPIERIVITADEESFVRRVTLYGRRETNEKWKWLGAGEIHAYQDSIHSTLSVQCSYRYLKVEIHNEDDLPLVIDSVKIQALARYLVFESKEQGHLFFHYGSALNKIPRYDLKRRTPETIYQSIPVYQLGEASESVESQPFNWKRYSSWISVFVVGLASIVVMLIVVSMMKNQSNRADE